MLFVIRFYLCTDPDQMNWAIEDTYVVIVVGTVMIVMMITMTVTMSSA